MAMLAVVAGGFSVSSALAVRGEESAGRAEILAGPVSRLRWAGASVAVAAARTCTTLAAAGFGVGVAYAVITTDAGEVRSEEHTSELQSLMRISYAVFCLKKK